MINLEEFVNEKLRVSKDNITPDIPLGKQGCECTFDDGIEKVQEILRNNAKCKFNKSSIGVKQQVIKILDSHNRSAMILSFNRL